MIEWVIKIGWQNQLYYSRKENRGFTTGKKNSSDGLILCVVLPGIILLYQSFTYHIKKILL